MCVCHIYRKLNTCTDALANMKCDLGPNLMLYYDLGPNLMFYERVFDKKNLF